MHTKRKVCVVITARPSYSRIKTALNAIQAHPDPSRSPSSPRPRCSRATERRASSRTIITDRRPVYGVEGENPGDTKTTTLAARTGDGIRHLRPGRRRDGGGIAARRSRQRSPRPSPEHRSRTQGGEAPDRSTRRCARDYRSPILHLVSTGALAGRVIKMGEDPDTVYDRLSAHRSRLRDRVASPALDFDPMGSTAASAGRSICPAATWSSCSIR
jgi:hypothetical protein